MNFSFKNLAIDSFSKLSCSITWHQWQVEYPIDRNIGRFRSFAFRNASSPHGYQSTGLFLCWSRYGDFSLASLLVKLLPILLEMKQWTIWRRRRTNKPIQEIKCRQILETKEMLGSHQSRSRKTRKRNANFLLSARSWVSNTKLVFRLSGDRVILFWFERCWTVMCLGILWR